MLTNLFIRNIAVIDELNIEVSEGMSVLTGETGAGKSIIIDSINLILGARTNKSLVRYGAEKANVQAVFEVGNAVIDILRKNGVECEENQIIISREITADGKSVCRINATIVPAQLLRELSLINIHGQQDNQSLLMPSKHIMFLDAFAQNEKERQVYKQAYYAAAELRNKIEALSIDEKERIQKIDMLSYQIEEIEHAKLVPGEEETLREQREIVENAEKITVCMEEAYSNLYESETIQPAYDGIGVAVKALEKIVSYDEKISDIHDRISEAMYTIEDNVHEIREYLETVEYDETVLNDIEKRLDLIAKLKRKYGANIDEILLFCQNAKTELAQIQDSDEQIQVLSKELETCTADLIHAGTALSNTRKTAAKKLETLIEASLAELNMPKSRFSVLINTDGSIYENGMDRVEFLISTNVGEPLKPLVKIASGGELSRVMLAVKSILADTDSVDTLIFDEIDTGVSGSAAQKIAIKLMQTAKRRQVICITHLPQIAAMADHQFLIQKEEQETRVKTVVREVRKTDRERELARMIDGSNITDTALSHAREMLNKAQSMKDGEKGV